MGEESRCNNWVDWTDRASTKFLLFHSFLVSGWFKNWRALINAMWFCLGLLQCKFWSIDLFLLLCSYILFLLKTGPIRERLLFFKLSFKEPLLWVKHKYVIFIPTFLLLKVCHKCNMLCVQGLTKRALTAGLFIRMNNWMEFKCLIIRD